MVKIVCGNRGVLLAGSEIPSFLLVMLCLALFIGGSYRYLMRSVRKVAIKGSSASGPGLHCGSLRPAELAYLIRNGDLSHTIIVLSFDVLHRAVKQIPENEGGVELTDYEQQIWSATKTFLKDFANRKAAYVVGGQLTPARIIARLPNLVKTVSSSSREMVARVAKDPRNIRRYISSAGVLRLAADFWACGYQKMIESKLREHLLAAGLLVSESRRRHCARWLVLTGGAGLIVLAAASFLLIKGLTLAVVCFVASLLNTAWLRLALGMVELIPIFGEFKEVSATIERKSLRLKVVRGILTWAQGIIWTVILLPLVFLLFFEFALMNLCFGPVEPVLFFAVLAMMVNWFILLKLVVDAFFISVNELPSERAVELVESRKAALKSASPLKTFQSLLASPSYSPEFSEILAIYGIETLWLLA